MQFFKKYKAQKKYEPKISKIQNTNKKIRTQNFKNTKYKKYKFNNGPESQPHVHFEKQEPTCEINAKPTCCIF